ncbi:unnamed protein product [Bursaphelenchus okinawaensis]|uniref:Uncharacterized protein n=1 Tax=Bursaphelenchus okinawaensis TaxID=465554 RepID=A0A811JRY6_9BILA|nr:unnamed protein product [Bursaphelenchus okinawaensis]CAG9080836.1 unnamed protein product [Bursaphelenchus okinawaensis]
MRLSGRFHLWPPPYPRIGERQEQLARYRLRLLCRGFTVGARLWAAEFRTSEAAGCRSTNAAAGPASSAQANCVCQTRPVRHCREDREADVSDQRSDGFRNPYEAIMRTPKSVRFEALNPESRIQNYANPEPIQNQTPPRYPHNNLHNSLDSVDTDRHVDVDGCVDIDGISCGSPTCTSSCSTLCTFISSSSSNTCRTPVNLNCKIESSKTTSSTVIPKPSLPSTLSSSPSLSAVTRGLTSWFSYSLYHFFLVMCIFTSVQAQSSKDSSRLYETLLSDYNKLVRPVYNNTDTLVVYFKLKLSQLLDVHEKNQIMTTNVWLHHTWRDQKLTWDPDEYGGVKQLYVPVDLIWLPDIVLYNNADGNYQVSIMHKAKLNYDGTVEWSPPAIYKSMCQIDVEWFPLDVQTCEMKFGSWTYGGFEVDLKHKDEHLQREEQIRVQGIDGEYNETVWVVDQGIDLSDYYPSVEWDILSVPAKRHEKRYPCCESPFIDLTYEIHLRRKTLFYTVNLMIPCVGISALTALVFYLPSDGGEKISLCISVLISLTVFFLLLVEIIPSTSLVIPLIGKYLLFTMVLVTLSVIVTVITLNVHYRQPSTHKMGRFVRWLFIETLPYYLFMRRPAQIYENTSPPQEFSPIAMQLVTGGNSSRKSTRPSLYSRPSILLEHGDHLQVHRPSDTHPALISRTGSVQEQKTPMKSAVESVSFIADHFRKEEEDQQVIEDWKYVSVVMDRIFLILFTFGCLIGTVHIIFRAPTIWSDQQAIA